MNIDLPFHKAWLEEAEHCEITDTLNSGWLTTGPKTKSFEEAFCNYIGCKHAIALNSCTAGLNLALAMHDFPEGDEVITTPMTFPATANVVILQKMKPVLVDIEPGTLLIDPKKIEEKITSRTRAIIPVHFSGHPCDMDAIMDISRRHGIPVIEDCSQAHLAEYKGQLVGTIGDIAAYSLGGKTLTTDQGGMVITNNPELGRRSVGFTRKGSEMDETLTEMLGPTSYRWGSSRGYAFLGTHSPMTDLEAAVGLAQIARWDDATQARRTAAAIIDEALYELPGIHIQEVQQGNRSSYYTYGYRVDEEQAGVSTEQFAKAVKAEGIPDCNGAYIRGLPLYKYPLFAEEHTYGDSRYPFVDENGVRRVDYKNLHLPNIEKYLATTGTILFRNTFTEQDAHDIGIALRKVALYYSSQK